MTARPGVTSCQLSGSMAIFTFRRRLLDRIATTAGKIDAVNLRFRLRFRCVTDGIRYRGRGLAVTDAIWQPYGYASDVFVVCAVRAPVPLTTAEEEVACRDQAA